MKLEILKKIVGVILLLSTMWISVEAMAYSLLIGSISSQIINSQPNKKLLKYSYFEQIKDIMPSMILSLAMGIIVYFISFLQLNIVIILVLQMVVGVTVYIAGSILFHMDSFYYVLSIVKTLLMKKNHNK